MDFNWYLYFSVISVNLYFITTGFILSWNSPLIPKFLSNDTNINPFGKPITLLQESTFTILFPTGCLIGTLIIGKIPDIIGRKRSLGYVAVMTISSFFALSFATNIYVFFVFVTTASISIAAADVIIPIYITEIAEDRNRGALGCLLAIAVTFGQFLCYLIGPITRVGIFAVICGIPVLLLLVLLLLMPESPVFLASKGDQIGAINVLRKLRKGQLINQIKLEHSEEQHILQNSSERKKFNITNMFKLKASRKAFFIALQIRILQQTCGGYIVQSFLAPLFNKTDTSLSGETLAVLVALGKIVSAFISVFLIDKVGRRFIILFSSFICGSSMFILGFYFYFKTNNLDMPQKVYLVPIFCIIIFVIAFSFGLAPLPFIIESELLPNEFRAVGNSLIQLIGHGCSMAVSFTFPLASEYYGDHYCMFAFSLFCFIGFGFTFLKLPETKGKSFSEIRRLLDT